jgi:hypothetical protein
MPGSSYAQPAKIPPKYRPHRLRRSKTTDLRVILAVDNKTQYRPLIDRLEMSRFAGLSPPR